MAHFLHKVFGVIHKNGLMTFGLMTGISIILSVIGFISMSDSKSFELWMLIQALVLSFDDLPTDENGLMILAKLSWMVTFASAAFSLFLKDWSHKQLFKSITENNHTAIIGVGELSYSYINDLDANTTIILNNNENIKSEIYKEHGFAIKDISVEDIESSLEISNMEKTVINTGDDRNNINLAFHIINSYIKKIHSHPLRLIVSIENRELNSLFMSNSIFNSEKFKDAKIELKTYSFFEECAIKLFQDNFIDGDTNSIIDSNEEYSIVIAGDGKLANNIIYEAAKVAHLPHQNILNIHLVSNNPEEFRKSIIKSYPNVEKIPTLKIHTKKLNYNSLDYFTSNIWDTKNLTNVIVCYDDESINLEITSSLQDKTYLRKEDVSTKVLFGVFNQGNISQRLDADDGSFNIFRSFGDAKEILTVENLFDDENHIIAKLVNYTYELLANKNYETPYNKNAKFEYNQDEKKRLAIDKHWFQSIFTDKTSSLAQAKHIKMKLKTLELKSVRSTKNRIKLLDINRKILENKLGKQDYDGDYDFPNNFYDKLFDRMIRLEHNRWNAYHYLNGWEYSSKKDKPIKKHDCLLPIKDFPKYFNEDKRLKQLIEWDIYSFMYLPNYMAEAGYEIVKMDQ